MGMTSLPPLGDETWAEEFTASLQLHRDKVREFLSAQKERLEQAESVLEEQIELLDNRLKEIDLQQGDLDRSPTTAQSSGHGACRSWEDEKKRIIAMLDGGLDGDETTQRTQRLKIEDVLKTTDQVIADKDREIEELLSQRSAKQDLEDDKEALEQVDIGKILDSDSVIQEERKRLLEMQEQWREKLRQAEIELSMERAQLARLRAELDAKARAAESALPKTPADANSAENPEQPVHGRWLARMGLTEDDRQRIKRR
jgi:hypothetical protein